MDPVVHTAHLVTATFSLLLIAAATLALTKALRLPFTVILVVVGMGVRELALVWPEYFGFLAALEISPELILFVFLPTLIFESTFNLDAQQLRHNLGAILMLAVPGLILSTAVIGGVVWLATDIPLAAALLLGAILSATDPVAVIALFKQLGAPKRLMALVEGESLFNDATSIVLAKILLGVLAAGAVSASTVGNGVLDFFLLFFGGLAVGMALGWITGWLLGLVESDSLIEISLTTAVAYLSFLIAEELFHVSGVMACLGAGITVGGLGEVKISPPVRRYLEHFWEYLAFLANAFIFLLVGMKIDLGALWDNAGLLAVVVGAMLLGRALLAYGLVPLLSRLPGAQPIDRPYQTVMFWGGLRGAIALALVLSLQGFEHAELFTTLVTGAVLFTLLVQGLSIGRLMARVGLDQPPLGDRLGRLEYRLEGQRAALERIPELQRGGYFSSRIANRLQGEIRKETRRLQGAMTALRGAEISPQQELCLLYERAFAEEKSLYREMFAKGHLSEGAYRQLLLTLSLQIEAVRFRGRFEHVRSHRLRRWLEPRLFALLDRLPGTAPLGERLRMGRVALTYENAWAHYQGCRRVLERLAEIAQQESSTAAALEEVSGNYQRWRLAAGRQLDDAAAQFPEFVNAVQQRVGRRMTLVAEGEAAERLGAQGRLSREVTEEAQEGIRHRLRALRGQEVTRLRVEPEELLRKVPFFSGIPKAEFQAIATRMKAHTYDEGAAIIRQGEPGDSLFLIARGVVRVSREEAGMRRNLATLMAGDFFGEMALLHQEPRSATVQAVTPSAVYELGRAGLAEAMTAHPAIRAMLEEADLRRKEAQETC
jgi:monovalent cation:H+ antiporter, CPA1 family